MKILTLSAHYFMPVIILVFAFALILSKEHIQIFFDGAKEGLSGCIKLLPTLLLVMCGVSAIYSSGAVDVITSLLSGFCRSVIIPQELVPSLVLRPFSGSGVTALADKLIKENGADSSVVKTACLLMGATDTIVYTLSMYFSSHKAKRTRYALTASLVVFVFSIVVCVFLGRILFY